MKKACQHLVYRTLCLTTIPQLRLEHHNRLDPRRLPQEFASQALFRISTDAGRIS